MNVIIFGPPGAGKGTQAFNIVKKFNLFQVSTGDLLRDEVKNQTDIGRDIENIISFFLILSVALPLISFSLIN